MDDVIRREMLALLPRLRRFAYGITGSIDEGDDLVQATYERAIRYIDKWEPGTRLDSWMFRIARNQHLNNIRSRRIRGEHLTPVDPDDAVLATDGVRIMESHLEFEQVRRLVSRLPEEQRSILMLICVEGMSYKEVAELLELPIGTVTSRLARARIALREQLEGRASGDKGGDNRE